MSEVNIVVIIIGCLLNGIIIHRLGAYGREWRKWVMWRFDFIGLGTLIAYFMVAATGLDCDGVLSVILIPVFFALPTFLVAFALTIKFFGFIVTRSSERDVD